jgi:hypothetical protein
VLRCCMCGRVRIIHCSTTCATSAGIERVVAAVSSSGSGVPVLVAHIMAWLDDEALEHRGAVSHMVVTC